MFTDASAGSVTRSGIPKNHHIQALRGIAASLVVLSHAFGPLTDHGILPAWFTPVGNSFGAFGVYTFFVISGFIMITMAYDDFGHVSKATTFAARRIVRIVPTYWIATFVAFAVYMLLPISLSKRPSLIDLLQSLTFIPYSSDPAADMQPVLGQGWTLNYEMFFYAMFALALTLPRRIGLPALFLTFAGIVIGGSWLKPVSDISRATTIPIFLSDPMILLFAAGMAIGVLKKKMTNLYVRYPFQLALAIIAIQLALVMVFKIPSRVPFPECIGTWLPGILVVAVCAFAAPSTHRGRVATVSEILGDASYSTYLFHIFIVFALGKVFPITVTLAIPFVLTALIVSNVFGILFFRIVERPLTRVFRAVPNTLNQLFPRVITVRAP